MTPQRIVLIILCLMLYTVGESLSSKQAQSSHCDSCCRGPPGNNGLNGHNGSAGKDGRVGTKGDRGQPGPQGFPGLPARDIRNWKQCAWTGGQANINTGLVKDCEFTKQSGDTALRVVFQGNFHSTACARCCKRWFVTFNGRVCSGPLPIDATLYILDVRKTNSPDYHNQAAIEGYCENIGKGRVLVGINLDNCPGYTASLGATGWHSVSRLIIEEVPKSQ